MGTDIIFFKNRLNESQWTNGEFGGQWSKDGKGLMPSYFMHEKHDVQNNSMRGSSSPATTIMNNNSQDLYAEVSDVTMASGLLSTFHSQQPGLQNQFGGDPEPYATTTLAMQNTNARLLVKFCLAQCSCKFMFN